MRISKFELGLLAAAFSASGAVIACRPAVAQDRPVESQDWAKAGPVREIVDPNSGDRWLLMRDANCPGGPGQLVRLERLEQSTAGEGRGKQSPKTIARQVIRAGDRVRLEEHTQMADAVFEAIALGTAATGQTVQVRLTVGGRVVRAVATGPGHAALPIETGAAR
ncbi:MAG TPA: flagella basal body P-ring formation protein FlgA [Terracidiphilus sp.]|jgi:hypothetical protein